MVFETDSYLNILHGKSVPSETNDTRILPTTFHYLTKTNVETRKAGKLFGNLSATQTEDGWIDPTDWIL